MSKSPIQVIVAAFKTQDGAEEAYKTLKVIKREKLLTFQDAALLRRDLRNKIHIQEMNDMRGIQGAIAGGLAGYRHRSADQTGCLAGCRRGRRSCRRAARQGSATADCPMTN